MGELRGGFADSSLDVGEDEVEAVQRRFEAKFGFSTKTKERLPNRHPGRNSHRKRKAKTTRTRLGRHRKATTFGVLKRTKEAFLAKIKSHLEVVTKAKNHQQEEFYLTKKQDRKNDT